MTKEKIIGLFLAIQNAKNSKLERGNINQLHDVEVKEIEETL